MRRISARCCGLRVHRMQQHLALHVVLLAEVGDLDDVDQLVQLLDHLLDDEGVARAPPGSCATPRDRGSPPPTGSRCCTRAPRTARPRATARRTCSRPAPRSCACACSAAVAPSRIPSATSPPCLAASRVGGARIMSVLAPPAGTIGNTHSSLSTQTSRITGAGRARASSRAPAPPRSAWSPGGPRSRTPRRASPSPGCRGRSIAQ